MASETWFTADTHFGHEKVLAHSNRPFGTIEEHDETLIERYNSRVNKGDTVYHAGDVAWKFLRQYRERLNGVIHLIKGNHDRLKAADRELFASISDIKKVKIDGQKIYICHFSMRTWNCIHHGAWHLYGHSHGSLPSHGKSFDIWSRLS